MGEGVLCAAPLRIWTIYYTSRFFTTRHRNFMLNKYVHGINTMKGCSFFWTIPFKVLNFDDHENVVDSKP